MSWKCDDLKDRMLDYLEGSLPPLEKRLLETHLESCAECRERISEYEGTWDLLDTWEDPEPSPFFVAGTLKEVRSRSAFLKRNFMRKTWIAVAASLILAACVYFFVQPSPETYDGIVETDVVMISEEEYMDEFLEELELIEDLDFLVEYGEELELAMEYDLYNVLSDGEAY